MDLTTRVKQIETERQTAAKTIARCDKQLFEIARILGASEPASATTRRTRKTRGSAADGTRIIDRIVAKIDGPTRISDIARLVGVPTPRLSSIVHNGVTNGLLVKVGVGTYAPASWNGHQQLADPAVQPEPELVGATQ